MAATAFTPPEFWNFKPMFTLQPVVATREKQLIVWRDLILQYCRLNNLHVLLPHTFPYFKNDAIDRQLSKDGIDAVIDFLIKSGNAEWQDSSRASLLIIWKSPQQLAGEIYSWACSADVMGTVYTVYELYAGDENQDSGFHGVDPVILRRALDILESNRKCVIMKGATIEEDGVKFLSVA